MQPLDDPLRRDANRTYEQLDTLLDHDVDDLAETALGVVVVRRARSSANLRDEEVDAERRVLVVEQRFNLLDLSHIMVSSSLKKTGKRTYGFTQLLWGVSYGT